MLLFWFANSGHSQDIHFSQITRSEFNLNPAFTGTFSGNFRATLNWKDQWQSINNTFRTFGASAAYTFGKGRPKHPTFYAVGIYAAKDVAGDVELGLTNVGGSLSSIFKISRNQRFAIGIQGGYGQTGITPSKMQWGSQYNGLNFDPSLSNGTGLEFNAKHYFDMAAGISWWFHKNDRSVAFGAPHDAKIGFAVYHINQPNTSIIKEGSSKLPMRAVFHAAALLPTPAMDLYWYPTVTAQFQGAQHEILVGTLMKYTLKSGSRMTGYGTDIAVSGGIIMRVNNVFDAVIPQLFIDVSAFSFGLSYDINTSRLRNSSHLRGGLELSIRLINFDHYTHKNPFRRAVLI